MRLRIYAAAGAAVGLLVLSGCGSAGGHHATSGSSGATFPLSVRAANGEVRVPSRPRRIVSISATATEDLFAVGAGKQVIAVDDYSTYPQNAPRTKLSGYTPNAEAIARYQPDLVVAAADAGHLVAALTRLRVPVLIDPPASGVDDAYRQLDQLGEATGHPARARAVVATMRRRIAAIRESLPSRHRPLSVYHELDGNYYSATSRTFIGSVYRLAGLRNIADAAGKAGAYPKLSAEYVVASNPDLIVLADTVCCGQTPSTVARRPGFAKIAAVRRGHVLAVADDVASHWGPRVVGFLALVARHVKAMEAGS